MFSTINKFGRFAAARTDKAIVYSIGGNEWFGISKDNRSMLFTTGKGSSPSPVDHILMALGACSADDVKYVLEKNERIVNKLSVDIEGEFAPDPPNRLSEIRVRFNLDSPNALEEDIKIVGDTVLEKLCPVAMTLTSKPNIKAKATLVNKK
ncbi:OsmC family protein [Histomonas meleagridis]|uniref:OsmC family protein n=1 Tax=Histomonas meleagridis TaxID=135588 RepID=UPI003559FFBB|nr:OsmC family protein [Histomonas meleagridis]KAH0800028.1 OsmC family protein [Histomonas meleagridis]